MDRIRDVMYPERLVAKSEDSPAPEIEEIWSPRDFLSALEEWIQECNLPLVLHKVGRAWRLLSSENVAEDLAPVRKKAQAERVGPAALEVLALVAYRQPVLKADVDAIRGVKSGPHMRHLLDLKLVRILGRAELPGRPFIYGTTREFLDKFGLRDLSELPEAGRLAVPVEEMPDSKSSADPSPVEVPDPKSSAGESPTEVPPSTESPAPISE